MHGNEEQAGDVCRCKRGQCRAHSLAFCNAVLKRGLLQQFRGDGVIERQPVDEATAAQGGTGAFTSLLLSRYAILWQRNRPLKQAARHVANKRPYFSIV